jgi:site-specific DNA-methyltransferase (adenine-specific)
MSFNKVMFSSASDHWSTPKEVYDELDGRFNFNFDPCPLYGDLSGDGLNSVWGSRTFCNPPYSQLKAWLKKGYEESLSGKLVVFLIPSRTDTVAWHEYVMKAKEIKFIKGRLKFGGSKNSAPFPSAVVIFYGEKKEER